MRSATDIQKNLVDHVVGEKPSMLKKPVTYVLQGNGLWEIRKGGLGVSTRHIAPAKVAGLPTTMREERFDMSVPKISARLLGTAVSFFRYVMDEHAAEAMLQMVYDRKERRHRLVCPEQVVTMSSVRFTKVPIDYGAQVSVGEIHSHCDMNAAFSSVDDADELADAFYVVVGGLRKNLFPEVSVRLRIAGMDLSDDWRNLFDRGPIDLGATFPEEWKGSVKPGKVRRWARAFLDEDTRDLFEMGYRDRNWGL